MRAGTLLAVTAVIPARDVAGVQRRTLSVLVASQALGGLSTTVGWAADRCGRLSVLMAGAVVLLVAVALAGTAPMGASVQIGLGLFLVGVGWSCCTVAGSALLTESTPLEARTDVQGAADLTMNGSAAVAGTLAGVVMGALGFAMLNVFAAVLTLGVLVAVLVSRREPRLT